MLPICLHFSCWVTDVHFSPSKYSQIKSQPKSCQDSFFTGSRSNWSIHFIYSSFSNNTSSWFENIGKASTLKNILPEDISIILLVKLLKFQKIFSVRPNLCFLPWLESFIFWLFHNVRGLECVFFCIDFKTLNTGYWPKTRNKAEN